MADPHQGVGVINQIFSDYSSDWIEINKSQWSNDKHYCQWINNGEGLVVSFFMRYAKRETFLPRR